MKSGLPAAISYRSVVESDMPLLLEIYRQTRLHELEAVDWSTEQKDVFLKSQFDAQHRYYQQVYGADNFLIIMSDDTAIGRLYIGYWPNETRIIDLSLLPQYRGAGLGTSILNNILAQAQNSEKIVSLHVEKNNPAIRLYQRMGFETVADTGVYWKMERHSRAHSKIPENS